MDKLNGVNFGQFEDQFGNLLNEYEIIKYFKGGDDKWHENERFNSGRSYYVINDQIYNKVNRSLIKLNMDFSSETCGACYKIGKEIENKKKITGNYNLITVSYPQRTMTLKQQTYSDGTCFYSLVDGIGYSKLEHGSSNAGKLITQLKHENKTYSDTMDEVNHEAVKMILEANNQVIECLENQLTKGERVKMKNTIQLIEVGTVDAIPASKVREGDVRLYNYYGTGTVVKIIEKTPKTLTFITEESGEYFMFDIRKTSLVAIYKRDQDISMHKPTHAKHRKNGLVDVTEYFPAAEQVTSLEDATEALEKELEAYHLELQIKGMELTESKPEVSKGSTYKVIVSKDRENGLIGEFEKVLTSEELSFQLSMNEVLVIIEEIKTKEATEAYNSQQESEQAKNEHNSKPTTEQPKNEVKEETNDKLIINHNEEMNGIELSFPSKPDQEVLEQLKAAGFRWTGKKRIWYKKNPSERDLTFIESLGESEKTYNSTDTTEPASFEYPEIDINDIENYTISEELQKREHDAHWIFRQQERDYTKEIQGLFTDYNNKVTEVLNGTDNPSITYNLKKSLQYFKKHYHETYVKWLSAKANTPSWAVSGRGNMNISSYNKKVSQIDNHLHKLTELQSEMDKRIKKAERLIREEDKKRITAEIEKAGMELQFKMVKREWSYMGITENRKVHTYQDYWIAKSHGCFRIFKGKNELHACKTTESLEHAKKFVAYHIQQQSQKAV